MFLVGDRLSAVDLAWAAFSNMLAPLPHALCPMRFVRDVHGRGPRCWLRSIPICSSTATGCSATWSGCPWISEERDVFYGWMIVGISLLAHFIALGTAFYSFGAADQSLETALGTTREQSQLRPCRAHRDRDPRRTARGLARRSRLVRRIMLTGAALFAIGVLLLARVQTSGSSGWCTPARSRWEWRSWEASPTRA